MSIMQISVFILLFFVKLLIAISIFSCVKKIYNDIDSIRRQHHHSFYYNNEDYLAE